MSIFSFYKNKHLYANFIKIDKRVLKLGEMKSDVFFIMGLHAIELVTG